jgi:hypothetical protein
MTFGDLKNHFHKGKAYAYAWPGGYPLYYLCTDGGALCPSCVTHERAKILRATHENDNNSGWAIAGVDINWEQTELYCDHCSDQIPSAYGDTATCTLNG